MIVCGKFPDCRVLLVTSLFEDSDAFIDGDSYAFTHSDNSKLSPIQIELVNSPLRNNPS